MPFDFNIDTPTHELIVPDYLDFDVHFNNTRVRDKKYVINSDTDEAIAIIGKGATARNHAEFYNRVWDTIVEDLSQEDLRDYSYSFNSARNKGWSMLDVAFPNVKTTVKTKKHETEIAFRMIAVHAIDGSASPATWFGGIDTFCTNGQITGDWDMVRKKNTSGFTVDNFMRELRVAKTNFDLQGKRLQSWADTNLSDSLYVSEAINKIVKSERKARKLHDLFLSERATRGNNLFALYSAFTNYASYADERNGFALRNTGNDTKAVSMLAREQEVSKWVSSPAFLQLAA
jgi:L-rhamnose mutarotase